MSIKESRSKSRRSTLGRNSIEPCWLNIEKVIELSESNGNE